jgi:Family of unknown function (DUF6116)
MGIPGSLLPEFLERFGARLRFPTLFWITATLFVIDLLIPDLIPMADEILLGLGTLLLAGWKRRAAPRCETEEEHRPDVIDVDPES